MPRTRSFWLFTEADTVKLTLPEASPERATARGTQAPALVSARLSSTTACSPFGRLAVTNRFLPTVRVARIVGAAGAAVAAPKALAIPRLSNKPPSQGERKILCRKMLIIYCL